VLKVTLSVSAQAGTVKRITAWLLPIARGMTQMGDIGTLEVCKGDQMSLFEVTHQATMVLLLPHRFILQLIP